MANQYIRVRQSEHVDSIAVLSEPDEADDRIVELVQAGDLVITAGIPLADRVVAKDAIALDPRGTLLTEANIKGAWPPATCSTSCAVPNWWAAARPLSAPAIRRPSPLNSIAFCRPIHRAAEAVRLWEGSPSVAAGARISEESLKSAQ